MYIENTNPKLKKATLNNLTNSILAENILKLINFNIQNFDLIQTFAYAIITLLILLILLWFVKDLTSRIDNRFIRVLIFLGVIGTNFVGIIFYIVLRPRETKLEKEERIAIGKKQELLYIDKDIIACPHCYSLNRAAFIFCYNCSTKLETRCQECKHLLQPIWNYCPYCQSKQNLSQDARTFPSTLQFSFLSGLYIKIKAMLKMAHYSLIKSGDIIKRQFGIFIDLSYKLSRISRFDTKIKHVLVSGKQNGYIEIFNTKFDKSDPVIAKSKRAEQRRSNRKRRKRKNRR